MTLNRFLAVAGFLVLFTIVSHANDFGKLVQHTSIQTAQAQVGGVCSDNR